GRRRLVQQDAVRGGARGEGRPARRSGPAAEGVQGRGGGDEPAHASAGRRRADRRRGCARARRDAGVRGREPGREAERAQQAEERRVGRRAPHRREEAVGAAMALTLFARIMTLVAADAHGVVESLEERSLLLKQYLREAELEVNRKRARLEAVREEEKRLRDAAAHHEEEIRALDQDVALAHAGGQDDLARFPIRRLLARRAELKAIGSRIANRAEEARLLAERVDVQQARLDALRTRVRAELARESAGTDSVPWGREEAVADEEVELELMRR